MKLIDRDGNVLTKEQIADFLKSKRFEYDEFPQWSQREVLKPDLSNCIAVNEMNPQLRQVYFNLVAGTTHDSYNGLSWAQMLLSLSGTLDLKKVYELLDDDKIKEPVRLIKLNDQYFVSGDGNHRVCIGKFGWRSSFPALVTDWVAKF
ncbi:MAG TPA: hypothetical protein PKJ63_01450 [Cyclobacteriaceae bacterium]|nr:hypothetical protein [Cyclobacteriaceae bacterium]